LLCNLLCQLKDFISEPTYWRYKKIIVTEDKGKLDALKQEMFDHSILMANKGFDYVIKVNI
jgi:hypothetical protein